MKAFVKEFLKRGALFCGGGPLIVAVVYVFLSANGVTETVSVTRYVTEILTSLLMAFIAAGVSAVYTVEKLPYPTAGLIQGSVLLLDYLGVYLLNGWIPFRWDVILVFIAIFTAVFLLIFLSIYFGVKRQIKRMNQQLHS